MPIELKLRIVLQKPPVGVYFGLQKGSGAKYETLQTRESNGKDLFFVFTAGIKGNSGTDSFPVFTGPFVQGPPRERFVYIDIGTLAGQATGYTRRLKVPLSGITWAMTDQINENPELVLKTSVPGAAKDGTPTAATVKPFDGWKVGILAN